MVFEPLLQENLTEVEKGHRLRGNSEVPVGPAANVS